MFAQILLILAFLGLVACEKGPSLGPGSEDVLASAAQADCGFVQNSYGQRVSWKSNIPVVLQLHKSYPEEFVETLKKAAQHWNDAAGLTLFRFERNDNLATDSTKRDKLSTIHWMLTWNEAQKNQQAVTTIYWSGNTLYETDMAIDNKYFNYYLDQPATPAEVHLESLLVHELGHALGLDHKKTVPSVMWPILNGASVRIDLTSADRDTIKCEY